MSEYYIFDAPLDVILSETEVRQPDLIMVHRSRSHILTQRGIEGAPDLVAEVVSPSYRWRDKVQKLKAYAKYAIPEYWIIDPASQTLEQYVLSGSVYDLVNVYAQDDPVNSDKLTNVSFTMNDIFSQVPDLPESTE